MSERPEIIPEKERSPLPLSGEIVLEHPDLKKANDWILHSYTPPEKDLCIFLPCSRTKPYHKSPSHRVYTDVIYRVIVPERVHLVTFGTCGVVPRELDEVYPFAHYDFFFGRCNVAKIRERFIRMESKRLRDYLLKTEGNYRWRIAYCIGDFRRAMERAVELSGIEVKIVPKWETIMRNMMPDKRFLYGSLMLRDYLQDLADAISELTSLPRIRVEIEDNRVKDTDWY